MSEHSPAIAARLIIGVIGATVANVLYNEWAGRFLIAAPWVLTALVVLWVMAGAASDDGDIRKAGAWALCGIGVVSACTTLLFVFAATFIVGGRSYLF